MIFGLWNADKNTAPAIDGMIRFKTAWGLGPDAPPILETPSLTIWADGADDQLSGWRGDVFIVCRGMVFDTLIPVPTGLGDDTLSLLAYLYNEHGEDFARHVNGAFSLTVYDRRLDQLRLIQSRNPDSTALTWTCGEWGLCFSNHIRALLAFNPEAATQTSREGLYQLLFRSYIVAPRTIYSTISQIPFGSLLRVETETLIEYDAWDIPQERITNEAEALDRFEHLLTDAMAKFMNRAEDQVYLLSGGYDSSVNVALGGNITSDQLITIGIGAEKYNTDAPYARMVAKHVGTDHREYIFDGSEVEKLPGYICTLETPYYEPGMLLTCRALELARDNGLSVIGGEGTDQVFGACAAAAYARHRRSGALRRPARQIMHALAHNTLTRSNVFLSRLENRFFGRDNINTWCGVMGFSNQEIRELADARYWQECGYDSESLDDDNLDEMMRFGCQTLNRDYIYYGILPICGRLADSLGLKTFTPYLDKRVMDFILSLDPSLRTPMLDPAQGRFDFKYLQKALALKLLPAEIFERPKQGGAIHPFIHLEDKQRLDAIKRRFSKSEFLSRIFRPQPLQALFNEPRQNSSKIFLLLSMDLWHELVAKNPSSPVRQAPTLSEYLEG